MQICITIPAEHGPPLRAALEELSDLVSRRAEGRAEYRREHSLTQALAALGVLRAAVNKQVATSDPHYAP